MLTESITQQDRESRLGNARVSQEMLPVSGGLHVQQRSPLLLRKLKDKDCDGLVTLLRQSRTRGPILKLFMSVH